MAENILQALWADPRVPDPPPRTWRDWSIAGAIIPLAVLELLLRDDIVWPAVSFGFCVLIAIAVLFRRTHPLQMVILTFGGIVIADIAALISGVGTFGLYTAAFVLLLPYALFRWASGRQAAIGLAVTLTAATFSVINDQTGVGDVIGGYIVLLFPALLGAEVRHLSRARRQELEQVKLREREQLARELHDTVAHHVSAIAIQAQAGLAVADTQPDATASVLRTIEEAASRTLTEMRNIVGALRTGDEVELAPQPGIADLTRLAQPSPTDSVVPMVIDVADDLGDVSPSVDAAIYRIAQESITNAHRHACDATRVDVIVSADSDEVHVTVRDDGRRHAADTVEPDGYGLVGMAERVELLGGTIEAGPIDDRGWRVMASLPRHGAHR